MKYKVIQGWGATYVVTGHERPWGAPQPNFMGSGLALTGILRDGETVDDFVNKRLPAIKERAKKTATREWSRHKNRSYKSKR